MNVRSIVGAWLIVSGCICNLSAIVCASTCDEKWFSRMAVGFILWGLWFCGTRNDK